MARRSPSTLSESIVDALLEGGQYRFVTSCVGCGDGQKIMDMVEVSRDVSYAEFMRNVDLNDLLTMTPAGMYRWSPQTLRKAGLSGDEVEAYQAQRADLKLRDDWAVHFHKSTYEGRPCYYMDHSRIEYIFC